MAVAVLQDCELRSLKVAERDELAQAWKILLESKTAWAARYPAELRLAFGQCVEAAQQEVDTQHLPKSDLAARSASRRDADTLTLVDDADVTQAIASSRLLQQILPRVEHSLADLDGLMSSAQGLANVRPELNPLRPEIFANVLQGILDSARSGTSVLVLWTRHLAEPLAREIQNIYVRVTLLLERANVQAAHYRVLQTAGRADPRHRSDACSGTVAVSDNSTDSGDKESSRPSSRYADLSNHEIRNDLFQEFLFNGSNAQQRLAPSYYATIEEELSALKSRPDTAAAPLHDTTPREGAEQARYHGLAAVDRPARHVDVSSPLSAQVWGVYGRSRERAIVRTQLKKEATQVGQVLGLEVVRKLVNQVAQDGRLLAPVREAIVALEPSLLRLAMVDPRFFSDERHPGRRLMERVAQRSFKYNDEYSSEFAGFFGALTRAFNELNALAIADSRPFAMVLAGLEQAWDEQDQAEFESRQKVLKALHFAEERQGRADQIAFDMSSRSDLENVPGVVLDFLFGPWSLAMAHARLLDSRNQIDPEGFGSVVPDLLWSVKRDVTLKRPARLIEMIPGLLAKLHTGLDMLGQSPKENDRFFESLMKLHRPVLKLRRLKSQRDAEESQAMALEPEELPATPEQRRARLAGQPWLGREDLDAAGFEDTLPTAPGELEGLEPDEGVWNGKAAQVMPADQPRAFREDGNDLSGVSTQQAEVILMSLRTGHWVDLYSKHQWLRAQLIWASTKATLFMFLSHGGQPHSMTKRSCEKLIMQRWLRPVNSQAVVGHALDTVTAHAQARARGWSPSRQDFSPSSAPRDEFETV